MSDKPAVFSRKIYSRPDPCRLHPNAGPEVLETLASVADGDRPMADRETEKLNNFTLLRDLALANDDARNWLGITINTNVKNFPLVRANRDLDRAMSRLNSHFLGARWTKKARKVMLVLQPAHDNFWGYTHWHGLISYTAAAVAASEAQAATREAFRRVFRKVTVDIAEVYDAGGWASYCLGRRQRYSCGNPREGLYLFT